MSEPMTQRGRDLRDDPHQHGLMCDPRRADWCECGQTENILAIEAEAAALERQAAAERVRELGVEGGIPPDAYEMKGRAIRAVLDEPTDA